MRCILKLILPIIIILSLSGCYSNQKYNEPAPIKTVEVVQEPKVTSETYPLEPYPDISNNGTIDNNSVVIIDNQGQQNINTNVEPQKMDETNDLQNSLSLTPVENNSIADDTINELANTGTNNDVNEKNMQPPNNNFTITDTDMNSVVSQKTQITEKNAPGSYSNPIKFEQR